jgi:hypothetical protein
MKLCFECGKESDHEHHVVPRLVGGTKTIPLCSGCHGLAHGFEGREGHRQLTILGLQKAKERGVKLGSSGIANLANASAARKKYAKEFADSMMPMILKIKDENRKISKRGVVKEISQRAIVSELNRIGIKTVNNCNWHLHNLQRCLTRAASES